MLIRVGTRLTNFRKLVSGQLLVSVPTDDSEIRLEIVRSWELMVLQEMLAGGSSPVRVLADLDTDVLAIPAQTLVDAMDNSRLIARDIIAATEARLQAIMPLNRELRVVALTVHKTEGVPLLA